MQQYNFQERGGGDHVPRGRLVSEGEGRNDLYGVPPTFIPPLPKWKPWKIVYFDVLKLEWLKYSYILMIQNYVDTFTGFSCLVMPKNGWIQFLYCLHFLKLNNSEIRKVWPMNDLIAFCQFCFFFSFSFCHFANFGLQSYNKVKLVFSSVSYWISSLHLD